MLSQRSIDDGANWRRMPDRRHSSDRLPGRSAHEIGIGPAKPQAQDRAKVLHVDPMRTAGEDQQRDCFAGRIFRLGTEDQAVDDAPDVDSECCGGLCRGASRVRQLAHLRVRPGCSQGILYAGCVAVQTGLVAARVGSTGVRPGAHAAHASKARNTTILRRGTATATG